MNENLKQVVDRLESWFLWFWIKQYKVSFLLIVLMIILWLVSFLSISKKSSPDLDLGMINITKIYTWVNPEDIDSLITEKIEREIKDIEGIKKITSQSSLGVSSITVELNNGVNVQDKMTEIKDEIDVINFPSDTEKTVVQDITSKDNTVFSVVLYWDENKISKDYLLEKSLLLKNNLEGAPGINKVIIDGGNDYEIRVLVDKDKLTELGLDVADVSGAIQNRNKNTPIGNYSVDSLNYDFRFEGEVKQLKEFLNIPIKSVGNSIVYLKDVSIVKRHFKNETVTKAGFHGDRGYNSIVFSVQKKDEDDLFQSAWVAKDSLEKELSSSIYDGLSYNLYQDVSDTMIQDYKDLFSNMMTTFFLVFLTLLVFIGLKEWFIGILIVPLSYLITFIVLYYGGFSLNFLTNFSLILSLWVAIDTIIVVIEWANKKLKLGFAPKHAILVSIREYAAAIISGTMTTLAAFIPMLSLPGTMWKYLSFIPITVFITLLASLFLSLTVTSPIFMKLTKDIKYFRRNEKEEETLSHDEKSLLDFDRRNKVEKKWEHSSFRDNIFDKVGAVYHGALKKVIYSRLNRLLVIFVPIVLLFWSFQFNLGFTLFPESDNPIINVTLESKDGRKTESMVQFVPKLEEALVDIPELKTYTINVSDNKVTSTIELYKKVYRDENGLRDSFKVENEINNKLDYFREQGLRVETWVLAGGPPGGKAVGIKLIANSTDDLKKINAIAKEFETYLKGVEGTKNVSISATETPGQFVFKLDYDKIISLGLTPSQITNSVFANTNGLNAGTVKWLLDDYDIKVKNAAFEDELSPYELENTTIKTQVGDVRLGDVASFSFEKAISKIDRIDSKITVKVESDLEDGVVGSTIQPKLEEFAENYNFPEGTGYKAWGEAEENADLIQATLIAFFIALFIIFIILVLQFNSYGQPAIILYSVVLALLWVNVWLLIMQLPYSMAFAIWFISLTGIVINNAIIYIDRINTNIKKGLKNHESVLEAWKSRLIPMLVTTITTIFGILPIAFQDQFWAGLWFTIVFGLVAGTTMTLFAIPALYFEIFLRKRKENA